MNVLLHLIILFIFVFALLMLNIPKLQHDQYIMNKLYIFFGIFIFEFLVNIFIPIYKKCIVDLGKVVSNSLQTALVGTLAYSIFNDLAWSQSSIIPDAENKTARNLVITVFITASVAIIYFFQLIFASTVPKANDCLNNIYKNGDKN